MPMPTLRVFKVDLPDLRMDGSAPHHFQISDYCRLWCFVHCNFGGGHGDKAQPSCHRSPQTTASHDGDDDHDGPTPSPPSPTATCSTLKTMLAGGDAPTLVAPPLLTLYLLAPISLALDVTTTEPAAPISRGAWPRDWIFTPEVSLGPALHSFAPPFLS